MNHTLVNISLFAALLLGCGACSNDNEMDNKSGTGNSCIPLTIHATASSFDNLPGAEKPATRTPVEDGLETQFKTGDAIGIFAIKGIGTSGGAIVDGINNAKLTYDEATKNWNPDTGTTLYWYEGVSYVAYYPYKAGITINATQSATDIIVSLTTNSSLQPIANQQDDASYTACDLMTASGTPTADASNPARQILNLDFTHRFALLVLKPQVFVDCFAPSDGGFIYRPNSKAPIIDQKAQDVTLNGVIPCQMADGSYRAIVRPGTTSAPIAGEYKTSDNKTADANKTINYSGNSATFAAGNCYALEVNSPFPGTGSVERPLATGDFIFHGNSDIEAYPGNGPLTDDGNTRIPGYNDAVGIVVTIASSGKITDEASCNNGWNHAYVMGLYQQANCAFGPNTDEVLPNIFCDNDTENNMNGYTESETMLKVHEKKGDLNNYGVFKMLNDYRSSNPVPTSLAAKRSPWFLGSVGQWFDVFVNLGGRSPKTFQNVSETGWKDDNRRHEIWDKINEHLDKVGKPLQNVAFDITVYYWCSTEMDSSRGWIAQFGFWDQTATTVNLAYSPKTTSPNHRALRPFFAF